MKKFQLGLDFHGVLNVDPKYFLDLINRLNVYKVHIMTGSRQSTFYKEWMNSEHAEIYDKIINRHNSYFFSVSDYIQEHYPKQVWYQDEDNPWVDDKVLWDKQKGIYARKYGIDLTIDDTIDYAKYFTTPFMLYVKNKK